MKLTYKQKIFLYFFVIFALFTIGIIFFEQNREKTYKTEALESDLDDYSQVIYRYIKENNVGRLDSLTPLLPPNIRVTIVEESGEVIFDNDIKNLETLENHKDRPEIKKALLKDYGTNIRKSASTHVEYLYYARHFENYFVRVALPYNIEVKNFLKPDNIFLYYILLLFFVVLILLNLIAGRFGKSIARLKDFIISVQNRNNIPENITFPDDELGEIGSKIVENYQQIRAGEKKVILEREKLIQHFHYSEEGLCIFTPDKKKIYANALFIQYLNIIVDQPTFDVEQIFEDENFKDIQEFLDKNQGQESLYTTKISSNGKHFSVRIVVFDDKSFEITINNITKMEKNRLIKQEMTNNIAHELRTPVTSIRGYLETLQDQKNMDERKRSLFIERAYSQTIRLSELIQDISLITKTEEAPDRFQLENVRIFPIIEEVKVDLDNQLSRCHINLKIQVGENVEIKGNRTLLYSIFRNLIDNSIAYGGDNIDILINNYTEDSEFYYFSYSDTGNGVDEVHLTRLFERFYRVNEGRSRDTGGSGLGLSIVKNAILFHKGNIVAKNRVEGGLEFLFTLKKEI